MSSMSERGLASMPKKRRMEISRMGSRKRAKNKRGLKEAGKRGGEMVKELYGKEYYKKIRK